MKKIILFVLGIMLSGVVLASVVNISNKSDGEQVSATEFNQILAVVDELYNSSGNFGVGVEPTSGVALDVNGILKLSPVGIGGSCSEEGEMTFDVSSKHLYGCSAGTWKQLDNDSCTLNGCEEETCTTATCDNGCDPVAPGTKTCEVTCSSNTDCDEPNPCTDDTCSNQGETNSSCSHSNNTDSTSCSQLFGTCTATDGTKTCSEGSYGACTGATDPRPTTCSGKDCGSDGCGGTCGTCTAPKTCNETTNNCTQPDANCSATTLWNCVLSATSSGGSSGTCANGYNGSCSYACNDGAWTRTTNNCTQPDADCSATTTSNCVLSATSSGGSSGICANGYNGSCSYACSDGTWSQTTNNCCEPVDGDWGDWSDWYCSQPGISIVISNDSFWKNLTANLFATYQSAEDASTIAMRTRACTNPIPGCGGENCSGNTFETKDCAAKNPGKLCVAGECVAPSDCTDDSQCSTPPDLSWDCTNSVGICAGGSCGVGVVNEPEGQDCTIIQYGLAGTCDGEGSCIENATCASQYETCSASFHCCYGTCNYGACPNY